MQLSLPSLSLQERELSTKRKECENLEHEVKKRQKKCLDLVSYLLFDNLFVMIAEAGMMNLKIGLCIFNRRASLRMSEAKMSN